MAFNIADGQSAQALYETIELAAHRGYAVESGGEVTVNSGTLGQSDTLTVPETDYWFAGDSLTASSQNVQIDAADPDNPRKDVVYLDGTGTAQVAKGTPAEPPQTQVDLGAERFEFYQPTPPALDNTDATVLAEVWVEGNTSTVAGGDIGDRRAISTNIGGGGFQDTAVISGDTTLEADQLALADASSNNVTLTLPTPEEALSLGIERTDSSSNTVTINPNGTENVNYGSSEDLVAQGESIDLVSDGTDWYVI